MQTSLNNFVSRFLICAVLLVAHAKCATAQWNFYAANGTLMSLNVGETYGLFNITGDQIVEKVIKWGRNNNKISDELQEIKVSGYVNDKEDTSSDNQKDADLCSVLTRTQEGNVDSELRYITTTLLLDGAVECPLPSYDENLISRGFMTSFKLNPQDQVSCSEPLNYRLVMKRDSNTVLEAVFQIDMKPLYTCQ